MLFKYHEYYSYLTHSLFDHAFFDLNYRIFLLFYEYQNLNSHLIDLI
jgi:hypothetical protein